jgi:hypothetical protein
MRAIITSFNRGLGNYQARTDNDIALSFSIRDGQHLGLNEYIEVDLPNLVTLQSVVRVADGRIIAVKLGAHDIHDLTLRSGHGTSRFPSPERLGGA